jgi:hypothetical protein
MSCNCNNYRIQVNEVLLEKNNIIDVSGKEDLEERV